MGGPPPNRKRFYMFLKGHEVMSFQASITSEPAQSWIRAAAVSLAGLLSSGCTGFPPDGEQQIREQVAAVQGMFQPAVGSLNSSSSLRDYVKFAVMNQPEVQAAFHDWAASVERITVERSLPDPRLTVEADIDRMVTSLMPGLMMDFPGTGKRAAAAQLATVESHQKYYKFQQRVLQAAFALKKGYYEMHFLGERVEVNKEMQRLLTDIEKLARMQNEAGKVSMQDVLRARIEQAKLATETENLEDSRAPLLAQFNAALGLKAAEAASVPQRFESTPTTPNPTEFISKAMAMNPRLKSMEAEVRAADASIRIATQTRVPDFNAGLETDVKANPWMVRPSLGVTIPIWKDKIAAQIAEAQANKQAAEARLSAEQIMLAVDFAEKSFMFRESSRNLELLRGELLPLAGQSIEVARAGYIVGQVGFLDLLEAQRTLLEFRLSEIEAGLQRELALAELNTLILGTTPAGSPVLSQALPLGKERNP
jgi:outer membrane protein, heavy metal efflux system